MVRRMFLHGVVGFADSKSKRLKNLGLLRRVDRAARAFGGVAFFAVDAEGGKLSRGGLAPLRIPACSTKRSCQIDAALLVAG